LEEIASNDQFNRSEFFIFAADFWLHIRDKSEDEEMTLKRVNERISVKNCGNFENANIILIPIIIGSHWLLVTISKVEHKIRVYDTSRDGRSHQRRIKAVILKFLKVFFVSKCF